MVDPIAEATKIIVGTVPVGPRGPRGLPIGPFRGRFNPGTSYFIGDLVEYQGSLYRAANDGFLNYPDPADSFEPPPVSGFNPFDFGLYPQPKHGFWASDILWTPPANGATCGIIPDRGVDAVDDPQQATEANKPIYRAEGINGLGGRACLEFDGVNDYLACDVTPDITGAFKVVAVVQHTGVSSAQHNFVGYKGSALVSGSGQRAAASDWHNTDGTSSIHAMTVDSDPHLIFAARSGASSSLSVDNVQVATGTLNSSDGLYGWSIGCGSTSAGTFGNYWPGKIAFLAIYASVFDVDLAELFTDLMTYYEIG